MHYNAFHDSCLSLQYSPLQAEVVYRSYGPSLTYLQNIQILKKTKEIHDLSKGLSLVNCLVPISLKSLEREQVSSALVAPFGHNHTQLEVIGIGGQHLRPEQQPTPALSPLDQCFHDVLEAECPSHGFTPTVGRARSSADRSATFSISENPLSYLDSPTPSNPRNATSNRDTGTNTSRSCSNKPFRFKRLAEIYPCNFSNDPIIEVLVDDKLPHKPLVYAYNHDGIVIAQLHVDLQGSEKDAFPLVRPVVLADLPVSGDEHLSTMFVSPHEFGVVGAVTAQRQLVVWDSTISAVSRRTSHEEAPTNKANLFRSSQAHIAACSRGKYMPYAHPCLATENVNCGTFTDRSDCCLLGSNKLYLVDLRSRALSQIFPMAPRHPPFDQYVPRSTVGHPQHHHFTAISKHPTNQSLYALMSSINNSILLWDIRRPSSVIEELPLPLIRQGRGQYRSLSWHPVAHPVCPADSSSLYILSAYCWDYNQVTINTLSIYDSSSIMELSGRRYQQTSASYAKQKPDLFTGLDSTSNLSSERPVDPQSLSFRTPAGDIETSQFNGDHMSSHGLEGVENSLNDDDNTNDDHYGSDDAHSMYSRESEGGRRETQAEDELAMQNNRGTVDQTIPIENSQEKESGTAAYTEFWDYYHKSKISNGGSFFHVNPFHMFPSPNHFSLPVCDASGLCFASCRPPIQVVVYPQIQLPIGVPSLISELRYFSPSGPVLSSSEVLMKEALRSPVAEAALSQLFTGYSGLAFMTLDVPVETNVTARDRGSEKRTTSYERKTVALALTTSGRLLSLLLDVRPQKRHGMFSTVGESFKSHLRPFSQCCNLGESSCGNNLHQDLVKKINCIPESGSCHRLGGPVPTSRLFMDTLQSGTEDQINELMKKAKEGNDERIGWSLLSYKTIKEMKRILDNKNRNPELRSSIFGRQVPDQIASSYSSSSCHQSLHEYFQCNEDVLVHPTFSMSNLVNFERMKLETLPYWRHPELDSMYWSEALMDLLLVKITKPLAINERTGGNMIHPMFIESIGWKSETNVVAQKDKAENENDKRNGVLREVTHCHDMMESLNARQEAIIGTEGLISDETRLSSSKTPSTKALTLSELIYNSEDGKSVDDRILKLNDAISKSDVMHWIANTGALESANAALLPYASCCNGDSCDNSSDSLVWRAVPQKSATPLCCCGSTTEAKPFAFGSENEYPSLRRFSCPVPKDEPVLMSPINRSLEISIRQRSKKRRRFDNSTDPHSTRIVVNDANVAYVSASMMDSLLSLPVAREVTASAECKEKGAVGIECDLVNQFCNMKDFHIYKKRPKGNELVGARVIQGLRHIRKTDELILFGETDQGKRQQLLETILREYPTYYSQLKGVRVTSNLYQKLEKEWAVPITNNHSNRENDQVIPKSRIFVPGQQRDAGEPFRTPVSSTFSLPFVASIEENEEEALNDEKRQRKAFHAISSQMSTPSSQSLLSLRKSISTLDGGSVMRHLLSRTVSNTDD